jgi:hypothetical protein
MLVTTAHKQDPFKLNDPEVQWTLEFFRSKIQAVDWAPRQHAIEKYMRDLQTARKGYDPKIPLSSASYKEDRIGWYLWLAEAYLSRRDEYEFFQGSRVIPFFKGLGRYRHELRKVVGIDDRVTRLVNVETDSPDSGIFEILVSALYVRNGAETVTFVPQAPPKKTPDLLVGIYGKSVFIECKRLAEVSKYGEIERNARIKLWRHLSAWLASNQIAVVLDVVFHREITTFSEDYLLETLRHQVTNLTSDKVVADDADVTISAKPLELERIQAHIKTHHVKYPSSFFNQLLSGEHRKEAFSSIFEARMAHFEGGNVLNKYVDELRYAACAYWRCDAPRAVEAKARDIRGHLAEAFDQIPDRQLGIVHIGIEANEGLDVEKERVERIFRTVMGFDARGKLVEWVYVHFFESESPPDEDWAIEETTSSFGANDAHVPRLEQRSLVVPEEAARQPGFPWGKPPA